MMPITQQMRFEPVIEIFHGVTVVDPYRWLEDQSSSETRQWLAQQTAQTREYLDAIPGRPSLRARVAELLGLQAYQIPRKAGQRCFMLKRVANQEQPSVVLREGESGNDVVLIDPIQVDGTPQTALDILALSPNGKFLAFTARCSGEDYAPIGFFDVDSRQILGDRLPAGFCGGLLLSEGRRGFYYVHRDINSPRPFYQAVFWHKLGTHFEEDEEIFFLGERPSLLLGVAATNNPAVLLYRAVVMEDPVRSDFYLHNTASGHPPERVLENIGGVFYPFFVGDRLFAFTDFGAPHRRIVSIDLKNPAPANWRDVIPEAGCSLVQFALAGKRLYVAYLENLAHRLLIFDLGGSLRGELPTPTDGSIQLGWQPEATDTLFYEFSSFAYPPRVLQFKDGTGPLELGPAGSGCDQIPSVQVKRVRYPGKDGTLIPLFLVSKKNTCSSGPRAVFLTAYGGFGTCITPRFTALGTILMELGCVFAVANVRGGAEFGKEWHEAAKRHKRQTAIDDFLSAAEWLLRENIAAPGQIAIGGGSNAGLLVAAALTQRPDLFRAVLCLGALLDLLRYQKFDLARYWIDEFGSADLPDDFQALYSYSPYHRIRENVAYPAVMFISGDADTRCNPMHTRKMTARLQAANTSSHPILLDYKPVWGHIPVQPQSARIDALTDRLLFLCNELNLEIPEAWS